MIVQLTGNITYPITLDPTVWIFDDRKIKLEEAFNEKDKLKLKEKSNAQLTSERLEEKFILVMQNHQLIKVCQKKSEKMH
ncbi:hypothetical protein [Paracerasibacillus soli]|uniref:Uncharacterized protein n=1 Tax=Paracerasibacillus soli TaxID=480284 RepID=A0ABU5CRI9_9BACI|nr:hypothetical protein [Virgibacillus soli]MDY0408070.1 hypothetical protein [Virgibacillus soli]